MEAQRPASGEPLQTPALRSVVFGPLGSVDTAKAIADRLRAAIGVGLLNEGDPLPPEAELARQFGVSVFSLREALATLREAGLIHTRAGRKGGSFVRRAAGLASAAASDQLATMSAADLRELDDWRAMLAGTCASLAARRGSDENAARLTQVADRLRRADDVGEARRLHSRFHLELAAAAQSIRMSSAELHMYREFDWLIALLLTDKRQRVRSARQLRAVAAAVANNNSDEARRLAEQYSHAVVDAIVQMRFAAIANGGAHRGHLPELSSARPEPAAVAATIWRLIESILDELRDVADACGQSLAGPDVTAALDDIGRLTRKTLRDTPAPLHGLGVMAEDHSIPGHPHWSSWWIGDGEAIEPYDHIVDPRRDDHYEYFDAPWMAHPREHGTAAVVGPYVDYGGTDNYTVTLAHPIIANGRFVGVAAADVLVSALERVWAPDVMQLGRPCAIINGDQRVIMANTGRFPVGELVGGARGRRIPCGSRGWALLIDSRAAR